MEANQEKKAFFTMLFLVFGNPHATEIQLMIFTVGLLWRSTCNGELFYAITYSRK